MVRGLALALILMSTIACTQAPGAPSDVGAEVTSLVQRWSDASESGDLQTLADTYADQAGFAWIERGAVSYADHAAILEGLERVRDMRASITNDVSDISVTPLGDRAAAFHAQYGFQVSGEGFEFSSQGVMSGVAIKQGETWRFLQGAFSELPAQTAASE